MERKAVSEIMLTLLLIGMLTLAFDIQLVKAEPKTWYVDDDGGADFTRIQDAIYAASPGDTIYVYNGIYYERLIVHKKNLTIVGENKNNTIVDGSGIAAVIRVWMDRVAISGFTVRNSGWGWYYYLGSGIFLDYAVKSCIISDNIITNTRYGISQWLGTNNTIHGNTISNTNQGISSDNAYNNTIVENMVSNGVEAGDDPPYGIQVWGGYNNTIIGNTATNISYTGIRLSHADENFVSGNIVSNTSVGIAAEFTSSFNTISGNNASNNEIGIEVHGQSNNNVLTWNNVTSNVYGIMLSDSSRNNVLENNMINNHAGIYLGQSSNNSITENKIMNNVYGVMFDESSNNTVEGNNIIASNHDGIWLVFSSNDNSIAGNNIVANNRHGIWLWDSSNNRIFNNNFINNVLQAFSKLANVWDDGYPSGGNYWSDYTDVDEKNGPSQDLPGSDGIWDHPYEIDANNNDNYPLVEPWTPLPRTIGELKTEIEELGAEDEIDNQGIVKSLFAKLNTAQKLLDKGKVDEAKTILADDFIVQVQNLSGIHITVEAADILIQSAEYILSHL